MRNKLQTDFQRSKSEKDRYFTSQRNVQYFIIKSKQQDVPIILVKAVYKRKRMLLQSLETSYWLIFYEGFPTLALHVTTFNWLNALNVLVSKNRPAVLNKKEIFNAKISTKSAFNLASEIEV